jgi:hypothetical protein
MRAHRGAGVLAVMTVLAVLSGCGDDGPGDGQTRDTVTVGSEARLTSPETLELTVESCNGRPEVTELAQGEEVVEVEVVATVTDPGDGCLDVVEVVLDEPFGQRVLVDLTSGRTIAVVAD